MSQETRLEVFDKNGWRKVYPLPHQPITHLGSDPGNDVVLAGDYGGQVAPIHAQLINSGSGAGYQLVNLADTPIVLDPTAPQMLPPRSAMTLVDGQQFLLGEFRLVFYGTGNFSSGPVGNNSLHMGLTLLLAQNELNPGQAVTGIVTVQNLSAEAGVQFEVDLFGLDSACFDLEPGPLLSSGAAKDVMLRLYHRGPKPAAGECRITLRATAPHTYPGEQVEVAQTIHVLPYYHHRLDLQPPGQAVETPPVAEELLPKGKAGPLRREQPASFTQPGGATVPSQSRSASSPPQPPAETAAADWWGTFAATPPTPKTPAAVPPSETAADWWVVPVASEPVPPAEPEASVAPTSAGWWTTPAAPEPVNEGTPADIVEPKNEESLPSEVVASPAEEIATEPPPKPGTFSAETPAVGEPPPATEPPLSPPLDTAAATPAEEPAGVNKWWSGLRTALPLKGRQEKVEKTRDIGAAQDTGVASSGETEPAQTIVPPKKDEPPREPEPEIIVETTDTKPPPPPEIEVEPEITEPSPTSEIATAATPLETAADAAAALDEVTGGVAQTIQTSLETGTEEPAEPADVSGPEAEDWWSVGTSNAQKTPPPAKIPKEESPLLAQSPLIVAPDWWSVGPAGGEADKPAKQIEPPLEIDDETDSPVAKTKPANSAAATDPANNKDIPDWWHAEPADADDENH